MDANLFRRFRDATAGTPEAPFLFRQDGSTIRYGELWALTGQWANALRTAGVGAGDRVAVQTGKSAESLLLYLACLRTGAVYLPLNPGYTRAEVDYVLRDATPRLFVCDPADQAAYVGHPAIGNVVAMAADGSGELAELAQRHFPEHTDVPRADDDLAAILYTSGTTGRPKGAMLTHDNLWSNAMALRSAWRYTAADRLLHALPVFHTHGLFVATNITLASGAALHLLPRFDLDAVFATLPHCTVMMGVPTFYTRMQADARLTAQATTHMRLFISGSAPLTAETHRSFAGRTGHAILERYGMTETNMNSANPYDGERVPGSVGQALPGVQIRITDRADGRVLPTGEVGMIEVRGPNVFKGYWQDPEKTAAEFRDDGFFITGDLGCLDAAGYLRIVGRGRDLVICGGFNVYPAEVESAIDALPGVAESAVIGVAHADLGEAVVALVQRRDATLTEAQVLDALGESLARYKQPRRVLFVDELPRNSMGKVQKALLREQHAALFS
jgi:malonyl-CoA/methylmalonyl-CoA synthetase